jgi:hypothetical protein
MVTAEIPSIARLLAMPMLAQRRLYYDTRSPPPRCSAMSHGSRLIEVSVATAVRVGLGALVTTALLLVVACGGDEVDEERAPVPAEAPAVAAVADGVALVAELDPRELAAAPRDAPAMPIEVGFFIALRGAPEEQRPLADARALLRELVEGADSILAPCDLYIAVEAAQLIALPNRLLRFQANDASSFGGHPPPGTADPELFTYRQDERLTEDARELFAYAKRDTSPNTIAVVTVGTVVYYAAREPTAAGGVSFPPNAFHHEGDYPLRNAVVIVPDYLPDRLLPARIAPGTLAHELGHMLLNSGVHVPDPRNLMGERGGTLLSDAQCERMRDHNERLFGVEQIVDPGPPRPPASP